MSESRKSCSICNTKKPLSDFYKERSARDGFRSDCKSCNSATRSLYRKTKDGVASAIYSHQLFHSKGRGHKSPDYSKSELLKWLLSNTEFHRLYDIWTESGHGKMQKPSCDRLDDYKPYSLDNLRLVTWQENFDKGHADRKNGINNKHSKAVMQSDLSGRFIKEHYSLSQACRDTGVNFKNISLCCLGKRSSAGGFKWVFA